MEEPTNITAVSDATRTYVSHGDFVEELNKLPAEAKIAMYEQIISSMESANENGRKLAEFPEMKREADGKVTIDGKEFPHEVSDEMLSRYQEFSEDFNDFKDVLANEEREVWQDMAQGMTYTMNSGTNDPTTFRMFPSDNNDNNKFSEMLSELPEFQENKEFITEQLVQVRNGELTAEQAGMNIAERNAPQAAPPEYSEEQRQKDIDFNAGNIAGDINYKVLTKSPNLAADEGRAQSNQKGVIRSMERDIEGWKKELPAEDVEKQTKEAGVDPKIDALEAAAKDAAATFAQHDMKEAENPQGYVPGSSTGSPVLGA